jgi:hypothetical protein
VSTSDPPGLHSHAKVCATPSSVGGSCQCANHGEVLPRRCASLKGTPHPETASRESPQARAFPITHGSQVAALPDWPEDVLEVICGF